MKFLAGLLMAGMALPGIAVEPHQHGLAHLRIAIEDDLLKLWLRAPLDSLVGFENAPRNARQREAVRDLAAKLNRAELLFVTTAVAECLTAEVALASDAIDPELLSLTTEPRAAPAAKPTPNHADLEAAISFRCGRPQSLSGLQVRLFEAFPALEQIDVEIATPRGDSGARLSPNRSSLTW